MSSALIGQALLWALLGVGVGALLPHPLTATRRGAALEGASVAILTGAMFTLAAGRAGETSLDGLAAALATVSVILYVVLVTALAKARDLGGRGRILGDDGFSRDR